MTDRLQVYESDQVRVTFDPGTCQHSGACLRALPAVFDVNEKTWIRPERAAPADVIHAARLCPSGALKATLVTAVHPTMSGFPGESPAPAAAPAVVITVRDHGSLLVEGPYRVVAADGTLIREGVKCGLCRCGASKTKPFCDGSHKEIGF